MVEKYPLANEKAGAASRTMLIFGKNGKYYDHIIKDRTDKGPAMFMFEAGEYDSIDALKADYPANDSI